ncbi:MAG: AbrB/MazE/SpoVT family DNA-binding domain-containing protein [bacterium]|nr:AbrB/MazE/SpoVT family DNA-binding domain-containing protein [bacterium]
METTIKKWGNSLAVRLPKHITQKLALREGSRVKLWERKKEVAVSLIPPQHPSLKEMVRMITPENIHPEIDFLLHASQKSFDFWNNPDDAIYDTL